MLENTPKGLDLITRVPSMNILKNAPLEMFLAERSTQLSKELKSLEDQADIRPLCALLALEMVYFLNCPQFIPSSTINSMLRSE